MRNLPAALLALLLLAASAAPHAHGPAHAAQDPAGGEHACLACVAAAAEPGAPAAPELQPAEATVELRAPPPVTTPVQGAPLGAIPGQSPPRTSRNEASPAYLVS